jgi:hypothetical protein
MLALVSCSAGQVNVRPMGGVAPAKGGDAYADARRQLDEGNVALAIDGFRQVLRTNPRSVDALNALGVAYDRLGRFDLSRRYYDAALQIEPANAKVRHNLALSIRTQIRMNQQEGVEQAAASGPEVVAPVLARVEQPIPVVDSVVRMERVSAQEIVLTTRSPAKIGSVTVALDPPKLAAASIPLHPFVLEAGPAPRLHVLNAVGRRGQAGRMRHYLAGVGWRSVSVGDSRRRLAHSVMLFPAGAREKAEALAASLPFKPRAVQSARVKAIVLVLGRNAVRFDDGLRKPS